MQLGGRPLEGPESRVRNWRRATRKIGPLERPVGEQKAERQREGLPIVANEAARLSQAAEASTHAARNLPT